MMIKILTLLLLTLSLFQPVQAESTTQSQLLTYILDELLIKDSQQAVDDLKQLETSLVAYRANPQQKLLDNVQRQFKDFIRTWKRVETVYVAGELDEEYLDHPRYIDYFNQGNESISELVERAIHSDQALPTALFKNSTKSINALEILLFKLPGGNSQLEGRRIDAALMAVNHISPWLEEIADFYTSSHAFLSKGNQSISLVINRLINSSYKLKNWRVGEAGGLVKKYQDKPSSSHLEYVRSETSRDAIIAILNTHRDIVKNKNGADLMELGQQRGAETEIQSILQKIDQSLKIARDIPSPLKNNIESIGYKNLFKQLGQLHNAYYFMLVDALGLSSQIIDADGD